MASSPHEDPQKAVEDVLKALGPAGTAVVGFTIFAFIVLFISLEYTLGDVVATLTMIETQSSTVLLRDDDPDSKPTDSLIGDPEVILIRDKPITSSIRGTLRYLTARAGWTARWRGVGLAVCIRLLTGLFIGLLSNINNSLMPLWKILATIAVSRLLMGWTHIVITAPSSKRWTQRILPLRTWKKIWGPTAVFAVAREVCAYTPLGVAILCFIQSDYMDDGAARNPPALNALFALSVIVTAIACWIGIYIPAQVTLVRVQASLLSESEEPIVPFDRTFGGRIAPHAIGTDRIGFLDAWRSYDLKDRPRLLKFYAKYISIIIGMSILFAITIGCELAIFLDKDTRKSVQDPQNLIAQFQNYQHIGL